MRRLEMAAREEFEAQLDAYMDGWTRAVARYLALHPAGQAAGKKAAGGEFTPERVNCDTH
jgi:hypothetical protein